jgi:hypothetical protein
MHASEMLSIVQSPVSESGICKTIKHGTTTQIVSHNLNLFTKSEGSRLCHFFKFGQIRLMWLWEGIIAKVWLRIRLIENSILPYRCLVFVHVVLNSNRGSPYSKYGICPRMVGDRIKNMDP